MDTENQAFRDRLMKQEPLPGGMEQKHKQEVEALYRKKIDFKGKMILGAAAVFAGFLGLLFYWLANLFSHAKAESGGFSALRISFLLATAVSAAGMAAVLWIIARGQYHTIRFRRVVLFIGGILILVVLGLIASALNLCQRLGDGKDVTFVPMFWLILVLYGGGLWAYFHLSGQIEKESLEYQRRLLELELRLEQMATGKSM